MENILNVVKEIDSSSLLSSAKAEDLYQVIVELLKSEDNLTLDFSDYEFLSTTFLNVIFGNLVIDNNWTKEKLYEIINIIGLSEDDTDNLNLAVQNAIFKNSLKQDGKNVSDVYSASLSY